MMLPPSEFDDELMKASLATPLFTLAGLVVRAKIVKVVDGDSVHAAFRVGGSERSIHRYACRIDGIDCPEMRSKVDAVRELAVAAKELVNEMASDRVVTLSVHGADKYGRLLTSVCLDGGEDLAQSLLDAGLAKPYGGGTKIEWTASDADRRSDGRSDPTPRCHPGVADEIDASRCCGGWVRFV
jgi:endonuclease YncB( thermonuclease family)